MTPLITEFPSDSVSVLVPLLRGALPTDRRQAVTAAWNVIGFAANLAVPEGAPPPAAFSRRQLPALTGAEVARHLEDAKVHATASMATATAGLGSIPWGQIIVSLMPILLQWLEGV